MLNFSSACRVAGLLIPALAFAGVVTTNPGPPPDRGAYLTAQDVHTLYPAGPFPEVILKNILHSGFLNMSFGCFADPGNPPPCPGDALLETFDSTVEGEVSVGGSPFQPFLATGPVGVGILLPILSGVQFYTEMVSLNLTGGGVMIRESPSEASAGATMITDLGGGLFRVDSFFDIFTEISLDGGDNWTPALGPAHVTLQDIPEPATYALFGSALLALALRRIRRA